MKDLHIDGGDIQIQSGDLKIIGGVDKIKQDLTRWLIEDIGYNKFHPDMGGSLDSYIAEPVNAVLLHEIRQQVRRSLQRYQRYQLEDIKERIDIEGDPLTAIGIAQPNSIIKEFERIDVWKDYDRIRVQIYFYTFVDQRANITLALF